MAQWNWTFLLAVWERWRLEEEEANGNLLPQVPLWLQADTPGPERFLITAQEPNYLQVLGSGDWGLPRALPQASVPVSIGCGVCISFAYMYL